MRTRQNHFEERKKITYQHVSAAEPKQQQHICIYIYIYIYTIVAVKDGWSEIRIDPTSLRTFNS